MEFYSVTSVQIPLYILDLNEWYEHFYDLTNLSREGRHCINFLINSTVNTASQQY